jgi:hypothetical protein
MMPTRISILVSVEQEHARNLTKSWLWQRTNSLLVVANLVVNVAQSQALPLQGSLAMNVFDGLDIFFTTVSIL